MLKLFNVRPVLKILISSVEFLSWITGMVSIGIVLFYLISILILFRRRDIVHELFYIVLNYQTFSHILKKIFLSNIREIKNDSNKNHRNFHAWTHLFVRDGTTLYILRYQEVDLRCWFQKIIAWRHVVRHI